VSHLPAAEAGTPPAPEYHLPTPAENTKLGVWVWLASDCALFASLIATYLTLHGQTGSGPTPRELFNLPMTAAATFVLLLSSMTMGFGLEAAQRLDRAATLRWLVPTAVLGLGFVGMQAFEFTHYVRDGLTMATSNFGASFYTLVGFHGLHVSFGVAWLTSLLVYLLRRADVPAGEVWRLEAASLYWYFVDVVWVVIFTVVYLMGKVA
jgi:cytochrome c oxidase subunit 3